MRKKGVKCFEVCKEVKVSGGPAPILAREEGWFFRLPLNAEKSGVVFFEFIVI